MFDHIVYSKLFLAAKPVNDVPASQTPSIDVPKITGPTVILQKPKPKISVTESAESLSHVSVTDNTKNQSNERTREVAQSESSKNSEAIPKNNICSETTTKNSQDTSVNDSQGAISKIQNSEIVESVQKDISQIPVVAISNGSEKELSTPKKERFIPPLPRSASK